MMQKDNIQAPWIGDDDYGKMPDYTEADYEFDRQDDLRKEQEYEEFLAEREKTVKVGFFSMHIHFEEDEWERCHLDKAQLLETISRLKNQLNADLGGDLVNGKFKFLHEAIEDGEKCAFDLEYECEFSQTERFPVIIFMSNILAAVMIHARVDVRRYWVLTEVCKTFEAAITWIDKIDCVSYPIEDDNYYQIIGGTTANSHILLKIAPIVNE